MSPFICDFENNFNFKCSASVLTKQVLFIVASSRALLLLQIFFGPLCVLIEKSVSLTYLLCFCPIALLALNRFVVSVSDSTCFVFHLPKERRDID